MHFLLSQCHRLNDLLSEALNGNDDDFVDYLMRTNRFLASSVIGEADIRSISEFLEEAAEACC